MRAIFRGPDGLSAPEFSVGVIGDELAAFVVAGAELEDLPAFKDRLRQYRMAVERAMIEKFIESASNWRDPR